MIWPYIAAAIVAWLALGLLGASLTFAYFQRYYPRMCADNYLVHVRNFWVSIIAGPLALVTHLLAGYGIKYGLSWPGESARLAAEERQKLARGKRK